MQQSWQSMRDRSYPKAYQENPVVLQVLYQRNGINDEAHFRSGGYRTLCKVTSVKSSHYWKAFLGGSQAFLNYY